MNDTATTETPPNIPEDAQRLIERVEVEDATAKETPPPGATPAEPSEDWDTLARQYTDMAADMAEAGLNGQFERPIVGYGPEVRGKVADALAPVLKKYNGVMPEWLKKWWPELFLGWTLAPIIHATAKAYIEAKKAGPAKEVSNETTA